MNDFRTIRFKIGEESRPIVENASHFQDSIFKEQYIDAFLQIEASLARQSIHTASSAKNSTRQTVNNEYNNNIFAFIGERGAGKTSCMMSVANMLIDKQEEDLYQEYKLQHIIKHSFQKIDLIDPSYFDNTHNIIAIIVAKLFKNFNDAHDDAITRNFEQRRKLIELFSKTQRQMQCLLGPARDDVQDDLNNLVNLSASVDLKETLRQLINEYLRYFVHSEEEKPLLLLMVDDVDLNTSEATTMAEQIRKYLILPNVIILMSIKLSQLERLKWQELASAYQKLLDQKQMMPATISEMVERYLTKLIPYGHRIFMPEFDVYGNAKLVIENATNTAQPKTSFSTIRYAVLELIFQKTRYLFYNSDYHTNYIIPRNLRELRLLLTMLYQMEDYHSIQVESTLNSEQRKKEIKRRQNYNKSLFKKYLFDTWALDNLEMSDRALINDLLLMDEASRINARTLAILQERFRLGELTKERSDDEFTKELSYLLHINNVSYNISAGDILSLVGQLEKRFPNQTDQKFLFLIRTFYSIRLYEYYDEKIELIQLTTTDKVITATQNELFHTNEVVTKDLLSDHSNFDKLVAGCYINSRFDEFLPKQTQAPSRSNRAIRADELIALIKYCIDNWDSVDRGYIQLAEFFMLCSARPFDTKNRTNDPDFYNPDFRRKNVVLYSDEFSKNTKHIFFDISAFFYNITRVQACYSRFPGGRLFYNKANENSPTNKSLWYQFKLDTLKRKFGDDDPRSHDLTNFNLHDWLSWCTIRNCEILQNMNDLLIKFKERYRRSDAYMLGFFFYRIARYSILTYDFLNIAEGKRAYYTISFDFCRHISNLLGVFDREYNTQANIDYDLYLQFQTIYSHLILDDEFENVIAISRFIKSFKRDKINRKSTLERKLRYQLARLAPKHCDLIIQTYLKDADDRLTRNEILDIINRINETLPQLI